MPERFSKITPRHEWQPTPRDRTPEPPEHKCARCWGPYGRSAIPCPNDPKKTRQIAAERPAPHTLDQLLAELDEHDNPKENR